MKMLFALSLAVLCIGSSVPLPAPDTQHIGRPECPHSWNEHGVSDSLMHPPPFGAPGWEYVNIPEYNDCQRFVNRDRTQYLQRTNPVEGMSPYGLFAIFAHSGLDTLEQTLAAVECPDRTGIPTCGAIAREPMLTEAAPAAWISAEMAYGPLHVATGANCVLLYKEAGAWQARIVAMPWGTSPSVCLQRADPRTLGGIPLPVRATTVPGFPGAEHYIGAARWDWDNARGQHYIGLKCGAAWCDVGLPEGAVPYQSHAEAGLATGGSSVPQEQRVVEIKGWYDEQYLAVYENGHAVPTDLWGTAFPLAALAHYPDAAFNNRFLPVVRIALRADTAGLGDDPERMARNRRAIELYQRKYNFDVTDRHDPGGYVGPLNTLSLCHGTREQCRVPADAFRQPNCPATSEWWARIDGAYDGPRDRPKYLCAVGRGTAPGGRFDAPPVTRWRWSALDEGVWSRCWSGCCEVLGGP